jgi:hypothetical protein
LEGTRQRRGAVWPKAKAQPLKLLGSELGNALPSVGLTFPLDSLESIVGVVLCKEHYGYDAQAAQDCDAFEVCTA